MRTLFLLALLLGGQPALAQFNVVKLDKSSLPAGLKYAGLIASAVQWTDALGENIVIITETGEKRSMSSSDSRDAELYAYHYLLRDDSRTLTWKVYDYVKGCPVDIKASFIRSGFAVTDLDKDNIAEVWLMYNTACRGDVSPANMKVIVYEGVRKYAMRGRNRVKVSEKETEGGDYLLDENFQNAPETFKQYAAKLWKKNIAETWK
jgi:hypothetical protein